MSYPLIAWSDDHIRTLARMWREGASASQIARALGITRNAALGKIHRLKITRAGREIEEARTVVRRIACARLRPRPVYPMLKEDEMTKEDAVQLSDLRARQCRWPIGDPRAEGFGFCGEPAPVGGPYCPHHTKIAYTAQDPRRKRSGAELARSLRRHIS